MKASVFIATSLDGFIARPNGDLDWLPDAEGETSADDHGYETFMKSVDHLVMGRHTYEKVLTFGSWPFQKPVIVLSSRPLKIPPKLSKSVERMTGSPAKVVARLEARGARHLYIDGGITIQRFLKAKLIQRLIVTRIPVLIGKGIPLFGSLTRDIKLEHVATHQWPNGLVQSEYRVAK